MKKKPLFLIILTILYVIVYIYSFDSKLDLNGDNANYIRFARNIANGLGYSNVTADGVIPTNFYPPGYPALLSVFMSLGIDNLLFFKILDGIFLLLSIIGLFFVVKNITRQKNLAFVIAVLTIFSPLLMHFSNMVMSEMFYLFCTTVCFLSLYKYSVQNDPKFWKSPYFYIAIVTAVAAYHIRTIGSTLIFAVIVFFAFRKEWKTTLASIASIVLLMIPWSIRNSSLGLESRYLGTIMTVNPWRPEEGSISSVSELIAKMIKNFDEIAIKGIKEILFPFITADYEASSGFFAIIISLLILAVLFYGAWNLGKLKWFFISYLLANIGLLLLWHGGNGNRYLVTIAPLIFALFYVGIHSLLVHFLKLKEKTAQNIPFVFLLMFFFMFTPLQLQAGYAKEPYNPAFENYFTIAKTMNEKAPKRTIVCCRKPDLFMFYAPNMFAVNYTYSTDPKTLIVDLINKNVEYVVLEQLGFGSTGRYLFPAIQQNFELFPVYWQLPTPDTYLLKFDRKKAIEKFLPNEK